MAGNNRLKYRSNIIDEVNNLSCFVNKKNTYTNMYMTIGEKWKKTSGGLSHHQNLKCQTPLSSLIHI